MITEQELFNTAVKATLAQGVKCCRLRSGGGHRCAVGHLLTDAELDALGDYRGNLPRMRQDGLLPPRLRPHYHLLRDLQYANDMALDTCFYADFRARAERIARRFGLTMPD